MYNNEEAFTNEEVNNLDKHPGVLQPSAGALLPSDGRDHIHACTAAVASCGSCGSL